jgi:hypothetical protein
MFGMIVIQVLFFATTGVSGLISKVSTDSQTMPKWIEADRAKMSEQK